MGSVGVLSRKFLQLAIPELADLLAGNLVKLYTGNVTPTANTLIAALTPEADFDGYSAVTVATWGDFGTDLDGMPFVASDVITFTCASSTTPNSIYGAWVEEAGLAYTDLVIGGAGDEDEVSSVARPFVAADVDKLLAITGGTGFTVGTYTILSVSGGTATLSAAAGTAASSGGTGSLNPSAPALAGKFSSPVGMNLPGDAVNLVIKVRADGRVSLQLATDI